VAGPDVLFSLLLDLEEQGTQLGVVDGELVASPPDKLSMRLRHELRRYKGDLLKGGRLSLAHPLQVVTANMAGQVEVL
jgi:hypothetical protein